jgi:hypothetical protein
VGRAQQSEELAARWSFPRAFGEAKPVAAEPARLKRRAVALYKRRFGDQFSESQRQPDEDGAILAGWPFLPPLIPVTSPTSNGF